MTARTRQSEARCKTCEGGGDESKRYGGNESEIRRARVINKKKNELKRRHLEFLERQAREKQEQKERELMTHQLSILRTSEEGLAPADVTVLQAMKELIRKKYLS